MNRKKVFWFAVPVVALLGVGIAGAGYKHYGGHHDPERMVERVSHALDLDPGQRQKLEYVKDALIDGRKEMRKEGQESLDQLIIEVRKPEIDQDRIMQLVQQHKARFEVIAPRVVEPVVEFHRSLNDEQRDKVVNLLETLRDWGGGRRWHG